MRREQRAAALQAPLCEHRYRDARCACREETLAHPGPERGHRLWPLAEGSRDVGGGRAPSRPEGTLATASSR